MSFQHLKIFSEEFLIFFCNLEPRCFYFYDSSFLKYHRLMHFKTYSREMLLSGVFGSPPGRSMPLEQACLSGREPRASSKNAEDRSNAATLLASRSTADTESNRRGSRCGSEKDSGYSGEGERSGHSLAPKCVTHPPPRSFSLNVFPVNSHTARLCDPHES